MKKLIWIIPLCLLAVCAAVLGIYYASEGEGGLMSLFAAIDRTDMMRAETYSDPNGITLPYRIYAPEPTGAPIPLVLYLHGSGESGSDNRAQVKKNSVMQTLLNDKNRAAYPCVVLAPQNPKGHWWAEDELLEALMGLLEQVRAAYPIDSARIYITGLSMGGSGTWRMLAAYPDYFAAAVPICGGGDPEDALLFKDVPIWAFHGARDTVVPPENSREMVEALEAAGATGVKYTEYPREKHQSWEKAYREPDLFPWMFAQDTP